MNLLLDTHVLLWWLDDSPALSGAGRDVISNADI
jgi:PIN domain nuclease of toxin-antitoxin system